ncbi:hypothetical protein MED222_08858 [Vibrio sp. MED222]|nr:hypothetical protein MED222_08858 [Vibrio sp. MED222]
MNTLKLTPTQDKIFKQLQWLDNHFCSPDTPYFWQHINRIAKFCKCSRRSVQSALKAFESNGLIEVIKNVGIGYTNAYRLIKEVSVKIVRLGDLFGRKGGLTNNELCH